MNRIIGSVTKNGVFVVFGQLVIRSKCGDKSRKTPVQLIKDNFIGALLK